MNAILVLVGWVGLSAVVSHRPLSRDLAWSIHNWILHPCSDLVYWGCLRTKTAERLSDWVHGLVVPVEPGKGPDRLPRT